MEASAEISRSPSDDAVIDRILTAVAETEECDPVELPPIYHSIDSDALCQVTRGTGVTEVSFSYHGYRVTVGERYRVRVTEE